MENKSVPFFCPLFLSLLDPRLEKAASRRQEPAGRDQGWAWQGGVLRIREGNNEGVRKINLSPFLKGTDLSGQSQAQLDAIALQLNMRPRKRFDFKCPFEVMGEVMQAAIAMRHEAPASITMLHSAPAIA